MKQAEDETLADYGKRFKNAVDVMKAQSSLIIMKDYVLRLPTFREATSIRQDEMVEEEYEKLMVYIFLLGAECNHSRKLVKNLPNNYALRGNKYPKTVIHAITIGE